MEKELKMVIEQFVDFLAPELTPYESSLYLYLLRNSFIRNETPEIRIGKRTIAGGFTKGSRGEHSSYAHVTEIISSLEKKGCINVGDTDRLGTLYKVILPKDIPLVAEKIIIVKPISEDEDYFTNPDKRKELFERDKWICQYCGDRVTQLNATLDHFIPQTRNGKHTKENLRTCCLVCNGIKSGKTYEEAAPFLLKSIQERRVRSSTK
jgi:hypothetical protein